MIKESYSNMASEIGVRSADYGEDLVGNDLGFLLREREKDRGNHDIFRSPSAPPTVAGSLSASGGVFFDAGGNRDVTEEEIRADPAYVDYYYSNVNMNPRLPPPLLSKEDWRFSQRANGDSRGGAGLGGIGDRRKLNISNNGGNHNGVNSLFSIQPALNKAENGMMSDMRKEGGEWSGVGLPGLGLGNRQKSIAEIIQDDLNQTKSPSRIPSRTGSRNAFDENIATSEAQFAPLSSSDALRGGANVQGISVTYASALGGSLSRSTTPDPQLIGRSPSPRIPTVGDGRVNPTDKRTDLVAALSGMNISNDSQVSDHHQMLFNSHGNTSEFGPFQHQGISHSSRGKSGGICMDSNYYRPNSPSNFHTVGSPSSAIPNYSLSGHSVNPGLASMMAGQLGSGTFPPLFENASRANLMAEVQNLSRTGSVSQVDPAYLHYLASTDHHTAARLAALNDPTIDGGASYMELLALQKAYLGMLSPQKIDCGRSYLGKSAGFNHGYYGNSGYAGNSFLSSLRHGEKNMRLHSGMRNLGSTVMGSWDSESGGFMEQSFGSSLLDEFKTNKAKCFELSEIASHVVEFSADQYGSRFIQQKLETATTDEKNMVFHEIIPQALSLMTDVFGNYVIQKFFAHGTAPQVRELADKLTGHVLTLSLQMYGCRVIQKAIEVVDLDQQKKMVVELDGHIMRCVRDQNGNHVIQKCIECIPEDAIQFIVSTFYDQVVTLSTHPYGCRVIQRILEHCHDQTTQQKVMDEIMQSVCMLAQDQYGNYVVQHVLEHGKPDERSAIIGKLTGKIVQMSQQKFASNVIEKCLAFGDATERRTIVNEMLGSTDDNEPLQVMMKDQFANYVVQKVLETCDDQQLELILTRIKLHLNALKKYTYGKHIVARVEKLVAAGEKRISLQLQSPYAAPMAIGNI